MARADAGESLRLTSNSPVGHPSILEQNPPAASMSPPVNQSGTVSPATPRAHCMGNPTPTKFPEGPEKGGQGVGDETFAAPKPAIHGSRIPLLEGGRHL